MQPQQQPEPEGAISSADAERNARLAPLSSVHVARLADAERAGDTELIEAEYRRVAFELRRRWRAGDRRQWPPIFAIDTRLAKVRERLETALQRSAARIGEPV
jgi:hypothetical protein